MATDVYTQVLWSDGEGLVADDLNAAQRSVASFVGDGLLQYLVAATAELNDSSSFNLYDPEFPCQAGVNVDSRWAFCVTPGSACLRQGSTNGKIAITPGTLLQKVGSTSGAEWSLLPFTFTGVEEFTLTNGDATNPRVDLLQMKLELVSTGSTTRDFEDAVTRQVTSQVTNKQRRVQCSLSVKAGTPAASPAIPPLDSGCVAVGTAIVGNGWTTGGNAPIFGVDTAALNNLVVHDQRMPLRVRAHRVDPIMFKLVTAWALSNNNSTVTSSNATNLFYVPCPAGLGRLVGLAFDSTSGWINLTPVSTAIDVGRSTGANVSGTYVPALSVNMAGGFISRALASRRLFEAMPGLGAGPVIVASTYPPPFEAVGGYLGVPMWTSGRHAPNEMQRNAVAVGSTPAECLTVRVQSGATGMVLGAVTLYVAEGL